MPELPEVETVRRGLEKHLLGREIEEVTVTYDPLLSGERTKILHTPITSLRRFGKGLVIDFQNGYSLAVHLKMTGQLVYRTDRISDLPHKHTHVQFKFKSQSASWKTKVKSEDYLFYSDIRKFGWLQIVRTDKLSELSFFKRLGREPLRDLTADDLYLLLQKSKAPIKNILMQQERIAGIGNIYASEALFLAKIHPLKSAQSLTKQETARLLVSIERVFLKALSKGGASSENFVNAEGRRGTYQEHFLVYDRLGKPCSVCRSEIVRLKQAGRSTFLCPNCQRLS